MLCPYSPHRLIADGASVSISTDDPAVTGKTLTDEYELVRDSMMLTWQQMAQTVCVLSSQCHQYYSVCMVNGGGPAGPVERIQDSAVRGPESSRN